MSIEIRVKNEIVIYITPSVTAESRPNERNTRKIKTNGKVMKNRNNMLAKAKGKKRYEKNNKSNRAIKQKQKIG